MKKMTVTHDFIVRDVNGAADTIDVEMQVEYSGQDFNIVSAKSLGWPVSAYELQELSQNTEVLDTIQERLDILNNKMRIGEIKH
jgi:hypothetical protein